MILFGLGVSLASNGQNSLLNDPTTGQPFENGMITSIEMLWNEADAALCVFNQNDNSFYVLDIEDNSADDAEKNNLDEPITGVASIIQAATGQTGLRVSDIQVNPISKSLYVLAASPFAGTSFVVKVTEGGKSAQALDLSDVTYSKLTWGGNTEFELQDMTWDGDVLYFTSGANFMLDGEIAWMKAPFKNNSSTTARATTMHKTNWGGGFHTNAPLEKITFANINGEDRLIGVTLCAPGFSIPTTALDGTGVLTVNEDFNIEQSQPMKVVFIKDGEKNYLFNLHAEFDGFQLQRIGQRFIDGTPSKNGTNNEDVEYLRDFEGRVINGLDEEEMKIYEGRYDMIAKWDESVLLTLSEDEISLLDYDPLPTRVNELDGTKLFTVYPNPVVNELTINITDEAEARRMTVTFLDGKIVMDEVVTSGQNHFTVQHLNSGVYTATLYNNDNQPVGTQSISIVD